MIRNVFLTGLATLALMLVFQSPSALAADALADTCADYSAASDDPAYQTYIAGYTAANGGDAAAVERATEAVRSTCAANPSQGFATTVAQSIGPQDSAMDELGRAAVSQPTSCSAPPTAACAGCSISCSAGTQATCRAGKDYGGGVRCGSRPSCRCK